MQAVQEQDGGSSEPLIANGLWARTKRLGGRSLSFVRDVMARFGWPILVVAVGLVMRFGPDVGWAYLQWHRLGGALIISGVLGFVALGFSVATLRVATVMAILGVLFALSDVGESVRDRNESREYTALRSSAAVELNVAAAGNTTREEIDERLASAEDTLNIAHSEVWTATLMLWKLARDDFQDGVALLDEGRVAEHCAGLVVDIARLESEVGELDRELGEAEATLRAESAGLADQPEIAVAEGEDGEVVTSSTLAALSAEANSNTNCVTHAVHNPIESRLHPHQHVGSSAVVVSSTAQAGATEQDESQQESGDPSSESDDQADATESVALVVRREVDEATDTATVVDGILSRIRWSFEQIRQAAVNAQELAGAQADVQRAQERADQARSEADRAEADPGNAPTESVLSALQARADQSADEADRAEEQFERALEHLAELEELARTEQSGDEGTKEDGSADAEGDQDGAGVGTGDSGDGAAPDGDVTYLNALPAYPGSQTGCVEPDDAEIDSFGFAAMRERADDCVVGCDTSADPGVEAERPEADCLPRTAKRIVLLSHQSQLERFTQQGVAADQQEDLLKRLDEVETQLSALDDPVPIHHLIRDGSDEIFGTAVAGVIDPDTAARIGPWAWVIVAVILILAYRMLEILNDGREPGPVMVLASGRSADSEAGVNGAPAGGNGLDAQATELVRTYLGLAQLQEPSPVPGGNVVRGITEYTDSKGSDYALVSVLLRFFQGTAFPRRGVEVEVHGSDLEGGRVSKPAEPGKASGGGYRVVVSAKIARTQRLLFVQPFECENLDGAAIQASHFAAEHLLNRGWTTPDWLRWTSRDGSGLLAYQKVAITDADPTRRLPSNERKKYLEAAVASSPDTGAAQVMLANELAMHRELSRSASYLLMTRQRHPNFLTGRYRLATTLSSITADMDRCWYGTRFDRETERRICEAFAATSPGSDQTNLHVQRMLKAREDAWKQARLTGLYEVNQLDVIDGLIILHATDPSWRKKFCALCGQVDLRELRERVLAHQATYGKRNEAVNLDVALGQGDGKPDALPALAGMALDPVLTNEVRKVLLVASIVEFGEVERLARAVHALWAMMLQKERSYWLRIFRDPTLRSEIRAGSRSARVLAERRWLGIKYFESLAKAKADSINPNSPPAGPKKVNTLERLAASTHGAGPNELLSLMKELDKENGRAVNLAPDDAVPRYNRACYRVEAEVFDCRNSLGKPVSNPLGEGPPEAWKALLAVHPDPEKLRSAAEDLRRARLSRGGQDLSLEWMEADTDLAPLMVSEAWTNARTYIQQIDRSLANLNSASD